MAYSNETVGGAAAMPSDIASAAALAADLAWERFQEQAAIAFRAGDPINPPRLWAAALDIAERHFGRGDPRLASSLTNQALAMRRRRVDYQAQKLFREALDVWDDSWRWIHLMTAGRPGAAPTTSRSTAATRAPGSTRWRGRVAQRPWRSSGTTSRWRAASTSGLRSSRAE